MFEGYGYGCYPGITAPPVGVYVVNQPSAAPASSGTTYYPPATFDPSRPVGSASENRGANGSGGASQAKAEEHKMKPLYNTPWKGCTLFFSGMEEYWIRD